MTERKWSQTIFRAGVFDADEERPVFAYVDPRGRLAAVIDAETIEDAWIIATGWGDQQEIAERKKEGWGLHPAVVEWSE